MGFHEVRLDRCYSYGARGGPRFKTTILELNSGYEKRNEDWSLQKAEWDISYGVKDSDEIEALRIFFYGRRGRAYGFRFFDIQDYFLSRQVIGSTDGSTDEFQIFKKYNDSVYPYNRNLTKIVADVDVFRAANTLKVWVNSSLITEGAGAGEFSIDRDTGIITLGSTLAATSGQDVEVSCEFDVPVRFDIDNFPSTITDYNNFELGPIPIVEVRNIT